MEPNSTYSVFDEMSLERGKIEYASRWQRFFNYFVDSIAAFICSFIVTVILTMVTPLADADETLLGLFAIAFMMFCVPAYYIIFEGASNGRTLGKIITGTRVVKEDISPITWRDAFLRSLIRLVPFEPLSTFARRPWHDKWSETMVIKKGRIFRSLPE